MNAHYGSPFLPLRDYWITVPHTTHTHRFCVHTFTAPHTLPALHGSDCPVPTFYATHWVTFGCAFCAFTVLTPALRYGSDHRATRYALRLLIRAHHHAVPVYLRTVVTGYVYVTGCCSRSVWLFTLPRTVTACGLPVTLHITWFGYCVPRYTRYVRTFYYTRTLFGLPFCLPTQFTYIWFRLRLDFTRLRCLQFGLFCLPVTVYGYTHPRLRLHTTLHLQHLPRLPAIWLPHCRFCDFARLDYWFTVYATHVTTTALYAPAFCGCYGLRFTLQLVTGCCTVAVATVTAFGLFRFYFPRTRIATVAVTAHVAAVAVTRTRFGYSSLHLIHHTPAGSAHLRFARARFCVRLHTVTVCYATRLILRVALPVVTFGCARFRLRTCLRSLHIDTPHRLLVATLRLPRYLLRYACTFCLRTTLRAHTTLCGYATRLDFGSRLRFCILRTGLHTVVRLQFGYGLLRAFLRLRLPLYLPTLRLPRIYVYTLPVYCCTFTVTRPDLLPRLITVHTTHRCGCGCYVRTVIITCTVAVLGSVAGSTTLVLAVLPGFWIALCTTFTLPHYLRFPLRFTYVRTAFVCGCCLRFTVCPLPAWLYITVATVPVAFCGYVGSRLVVTAHLLHGYRLRTLPLRTRCTRGSRFTHARLCARVCATHRHAMVHAPDSATSYLRFAFCGCARGLPLPVTGLRFTCRGYTAGLPRLRAFWLRARDTLPRLHGYPHCTHLLQHARFTVYLYTHTFGCRYTRIRGSLLPLRSVLPRLPACGSPTHRAATPTVLRLVHTFVWFYYSSFCVVVLRLPRFPRTFYRLYRTTWFYAAVAATRTVMPRRSLYVATALGCGYCRCADSTG